MDAQVIEQFRAGGEVEGMARKRLILLTTVGAKTGEPRVSPMMHVPTDDGILVIASADAAPDDPQWFRNLLANPNVYIEPPDGGGYDARATELTGERREAEWQRLIKRFPFFAAHQAKVTRQIPLVELTPVD